MRSAAQASDGTHTATGGVHFDLAHRRADPHFANGRVNDLQAATAAPTPIEPTPPASPDQSGHGDEQRYVGGDLDGSQMCADTHLSVAPALSGPGSGRNPKLTRPDDGGGHGSCDTNGEGAPATTSPTAPLLAAPNERSPSAEIPPGHLSHETKLTFAGGDLPADQHERDPHSMAVGGNDYDALIMILADALDDLERTRIATQNRLRSLGQVKGMADAPEAETMREVVKALAQLEHQATVDLKRAMRAHPLGLWVKRTVGVGEKQGARLLAAIGNPADRKMPSQLWQYCGHGAPSKRKRGEKAFWNPTAKMRLHLIAESCMKQRTSPYRAVYDEARMDWAGRDTSDGHKHNHALRMVGKAILLDLWREAKGLA